MRAPEALVEFALSLDPKRNILAYGVDARVIQADSAGALSGRCTSVCVAHASVGPSVVNPKRQLFLSI
jgi:hypothetical protein